jgi:hypothetical protein
VTTAEQRWDKVVADFRQLCLLRRHKKWIESDIVLNSDLPRSIADWSEVFEGEPASKKTRLDAMFQSEQRRIDDAFFAADLVTTRLKDEIIPSICAQVTEQVRATLAEEIRSVVIAELRAQAPQLPEAPEPVQPVEEPTPVATQTHIANFAEQVRSTVAQKAYVAVLQELGRDAKPAKTLPPPKPKPTPNRVARVPMHEIGAVIDHVLAEEQHGLKNKYKFELTTCP